MDENILAHTGHRSILNALDYEFHCVIRWPIKLSIPCNPRQSRHIKLCWSFENIRIVISPCYMSHIIWHIPLPTHVPLLIKQSIWSTTEKNWNFALNKGYAEVFFLDFLPGNSVTVTLHHFVLIETNITSRQRLSWSQWLQKLFMKFIWVTAKISVMDDFLPGI